MKTISDLLGPRQLREILDGASASSGLVVQLLGTDGGMVGRSGWEGRCRLDLEDRGGAAGRLMVPTQCIERRCPCFKSQSFSPVNAYGDNLGLVVGCSEFEDSHDRPHVEFLSRVLGEILTREVEISAISSDILVKYQELSILYEVSRSMAQSFSETDVCSLVLYSSAQALGIRSGAVFLATPGTSGYRRSSALGRVCPPEGEPLGADASAFVGRAVECGDWSIDTECAGALLFEEPGVRVLLVPLVHHMQESGLVRRLGLVALSRDRDFGAEDRQFVSSLAAQVALGVANCRAVAQLRVAERLERDLELAHITQQGFFPRTSPQGDGFAVEGLCVPARRVGGDYYDYALRSDGRVVVIVADVSGHSVGSAILMASARSALRAHALRPGVRPVEVLETANRILYDDMAGAGAFVSVFIAAYDPATRRLDFASAGHNPPLLVDPDGAVHGLDAEGILIGVVPDYPFEGQERQVGPGSRLVAYTDGVVEAADPSGEQFGMDRLVTVVRSVTGGAAEVIGAVHSAVKAFTTLQEQQDDLTVVVLETLP